MTDTGKRSRGQPRRKQVELALDQLDILIQSYESRVRVNPDDVIAGSSQIALQYLLAEVQQCLPAGAIYKSIDERLIGPDGVNPDFRPRVADELDLLRLIRHEFDRQLAGGSKPRSRSARPSPGGNPSQTEWGGGPEGEPRRYRRTPLPPAQELEHRGYSAFLPGSRPPM
jgi:hypothetical protein